MGVPIIRIIVFWGLYLGPVILGNYQIPRPGPKGPSTQHLTSYTQTLRNIASHEPSSAPKPYINFGLDSLKGIISGNK